MAETSVVAGRILSWAGVAGHLCTLPFYLASGLVAPLWAIILLLVLWVAVLWAAVWAVRARSPWGALAPVLSVGIWFGVISAGEALLGWTP